MSHYVVSVVVQRVDSEERRNGSLAPVKTERTVTEISRTTFKHASIDKAVSVAKSILDLTAEDSGVTDPVTEKVTRG